MTDESSMMTVLAAVLADPQAAKQRLSEINAAREKLDNSKAEHDKRLKELQKSEADANKAYKEASEARLASARDLKDAEEKRKQTQSLLDKITIKEGEINQREEKVSTEEVRLKAGHDDLALRFRQLDEREAGVAATEKRVGEKEKELDRKLNILKSVAA